MPNVDGVLRGIEDYRLGDAEAVLWFLSDDPDMDGAYTAGDDQTIAIGMFGEGTDLYIVAVPGLDGEEDEVVEPPEFHAAVVVVDGQVNGSHTIGAIEGMVDGTYTATSAGGSVVTVTYHVNGDGTATLTVSGCPVGLGGLVLMCSDGATVFNLILYSVPGLGAIA